MNAAIGDCLNPETGTGAVSVTDAEGNVTVYTYTEGVLAATTTLNGSTPVESDIGPNTTAGTASGTLLPAFTTDPANAETAYSYNSAGHVTSVTDPLGHTGTTWPTTLGGVACAADAVATTACSSSQTGPAPVAPGGVITPPSSAPPPGVSFTLYDTDGHDLYDTTGIYPPGSSGGRA